jgi:2-polyprenyl-3-methyl-5-hydroxy-6-metoxy-1,4-benzoquinol methylase
MECNQCAGIELETKKWVEWDLRRLRKKGKDKARRSLIDALLALGVEGRVLLDIGGGIGVVQHELLAAGASLAVSVEASSAYLEAATKEADRLGLKDRITYHHGDFVTLAPQIMPADIVTLDHVICCYHDVKSLVTLSSARARKYYGVVYPTDTWWSKCLIRIENLISRLRGSSFRAFIHSSELVDSLVRNQGLRQISRQTMFVLPYVWQVVIYEREAE